MVEQTNPDNETVVGKVAPIKPKHSVLGSLAFMLALVSLAGVMWLLWQQYYLKTNQNSQVSQRIQNLQRNVTDTQQQLNTMRQTLDAQQQQVFRLSQGSGQQQDAWVLNDVDYLLHLCLLKMVFEPDQKTVIALLDLAQHRLKPLATSEAVNIRKQIVAAVDEVQANPGPDLIQLFIQFKKLTKNSVNLPLIKVEHYVASTISGATEEALTTESQTWLARTKSYAKKAWDTLQHVIVVRRVKDDSPLFLPNEQQLAKQQIQNLLEQARWAAIQQQQDLYDMALKEIQQYLTTYFKQDADETQQFKTKITELSTVIVKPHWPNLKAIMQDLKAYERSLVEQSNNRITHND